jgi:hypothetical protein
MLRTRSANDSDDADAERRVRYQETEAVQGMQQFPPGSATSTPQNA